MATTDLARVTLRHGIGDTASLDLGPEDMAHLARCSVEEGINYLLSLPAVDARFATALRQTLQSGDAVLEIQQGTLTRVVTRRNPIRDFIQAADYPDFEIGVSKAARGGWSSFSKL